MEDIYAGIIDKMIGNETKGVDIYHNNGSVWLIFTDEKKWVIELTKEGTLWYNYYFFQNCFKLLSLDVVENQHYITKWVEDTILSAVNHTNGTCVDDLPFLVEDAIQNGTKEIHWVQYSNLRSVEDTIRNGVNYTGSNTRDESHQVEDTIQNGVNYIQAIRAKANISVENTIQNGIRSTKPINITIPPLVEDAIENGVKHTENVLCQRPQLVEDIIQNRVKHTEPGGYLGSIEMKGKIVHQLESPKQNEEVEDVIENGVINTFGVDVDLNHLVGDTIQNGVKYTGGISNPNWMGNKVEDAIENGVKNTVHKIMGGTRPVETVIENGVKRISKYENRPQPHIDYVVKNNIKETKKGGFNQHYEMFGTIENGIKETKQEPSRRTWMSGVVVENGIKETKHGIHFFEDTTENVIKHGVKETKSPGADGDLLSTIEWMESNNTKSVPEMIDDVITNGIKETKKLEHDRTTYHGYFSQERGTHTPLDRVQDVVKNGIKETLSSKYPIERVVKRVIDVGVLETKPMDEWVNTENILNKVINDGIKEVKELPDMSGELNGYGEYYARQEDRTYPHTYTVNDVIRDGVKETWAYDKQPQMRVNSVILNGTKLD
jgi:hypothetical protein